MAWIESHQSLREHPKLYMLMNALHLDRPQAVGHLHLFWWWCVDYCRDGVVKRNDDDIARAACWSGVPKMFVNALVDAGFLDRSDGVLTVHDWPEYTLILDAVNERKERQREMVRERVRKYRARGNADVTLCNAPTNITNTTKPNQHTLPPGFADFWAVYPRKVGKGAAESEWVKNAISGPLVAVVIEAVKKQIRNPQWQRDGGQYIPHPRTWLHQRRWEDEIQTPKAPGSDEAQMKAIWKQSGLSLCHGKKIEKPEGGEWSCSYCNQGQEWYKPQTVESGKEG